MDMAVIPFSNTVRHPKKTPCLFRNFRRYNGDLTGTELLHGNKDFIIMQSPAYHVRIPRTTEPRCLNAARRQVLRKPDLFRQEGFRNIILVFQLDHHRPANRYLSINRTFFPAGSFL